MTEEKKEETVPATPTTDTPEVKTTDTTETKTEEKAP